MSRLVAAFSFCVLLPGFPMAAAAQMRSQVIATGFSSPVAFVMDPSDHSTFYVVELGPDRYLYIGMGDGGSGGDPFNNAQNPNSLLGKMLRIDVNVPDGDRRGYRVPEDNPFVDRHPIAALADIWAFGLRNPWRYNFDDGSSITGGFVYRGAALDPMFNGRYFFADYVDGRVYSIGINLDERQEARAIDIIEVTDLLGGSNELGLISSFGVDADAEMYLVSYSRGRILKIIP
jgi:hypothetical protein